MLGRMGENLAARSGGERNCFSLISPAISSGGAHLGSQASSGKEARQQKERG